VRALAEGALLGRYRYTELRRVEARRARGAVARRTGASAEDEAIAATTSARAAIVARDLANTPPGHLTATDLGDIAVALGERFGFAVDLFDKQALIELGCGGCSASTRASVEEPRMICWSTPKGRRGTRAWSARASCTTGGISLKPSDPMHLLEDGHGRAAAVLGAFTACATPVGCRVTGWLMCTDNMPSGTAYKLGDVLTRAAARPSR
jgi:leucyl aminopeptidase